MLLRERRAHSCPLLRPSVESKVVLVTDFRRDGDGPYCGGIMRRDSSHHHATSWLGVGFELCRRGPSQSVRGLVFFYVIRFAPRTASDSDSVIVARQPSLERCFAHNARITEGNRSSKSLTRLSQHTLTPPAHLWWPEPRRVAA